MILQKGTCFAFVFLWFLTSVVLIRCQGPPKVIANMKRKYHAEVGSSVKLRCPVTGTNDHRSNRTLIAWMTDNLRIISGNKLPRFHIIRGKYLEIVNVEESDSRVYVCSAYNEFGEININITLSIKRGRGKKGSPPKFKKHARRAMSFRAGETARLKCHSSGNPHPNIQWFKDGQSYGQHKRTSISPNGWTLNLRYLSVDDSGSYSCRVSNTLGSIHRTFSIKVKAHIPKPRIRDTETNNMTVLQGLNASLTCIASSVGKPYFEWRRGTKKLRKTNIPRDLRVSHLLIKEQMYKSSSAEMDTNEFENVLVIRSVTKRDEGKYRCVVKNKHGSDELDIYLTVLEKNEFSNLTKDAFEEKRATVAAIALTSKIFPSQRSSKTVETTSVLLVAFLTASMIVILIFIVVLIVCCHRQRKQLEKQYVVEYISEGAVERHVRTNFSPDMQLVHNNSTLKTADKPYKSQVCGNTIKTSNDIKEHFRSEFDELAVGKQRNTTNERNLTSLTSLQSSLSRNDSSPHREMSSSSLLDSSESSECISHCKHKLNSTNVDISHQYHDCTDETVSCEGKSNVSRESIV